jgi:predicted O-methyltransferase YrrM
VALPALKLLEPHLRPGAVVIIDNSVSSAQRYAELLAHLRSPTSDYTNLTLPYSNGLEMCIKSK